MSLPVETRFLWTTYKTKQIFLRALAINICIYTSYRYANSYGLKKLRLMRFSWIFGCSFRFDDGGFANAGNAIGEQTTGAGDRVRLNIWRLRQIPSAWVFLSL
jgi:hypothetical protein